MTDTDATNDKSPLAEMNSISLSPIGIIHTPFTATKEIPIQTLLGADIGGQIELFPPYEEGLLDLLGFSHVFLLYHFHQSRSEKLVSEPFLEKVKRGIFSIRSPHRPNHIGLSIVRLERIEGNCLFFFGVDMLDGTPLLDIKPYVPHFDMRPEARAGWLDKHFGEDHPSSK